jgi:hypothetical protein
MYFEEHVYLGRDNTITLVLRLESQQIAHINDLLSDNSAESHSHPVITRVRFVVAPIVDDPLDLSVTVDSNTQSSLFDFSTNPLLLVVKLGSLALKPGRHLTSVIVHESATPSGVEWGQIMLVVHPVAV